MKRTGVSVAALIGMGGAIELGEHLYFQSVSCVYLSGKRRGRASSHSGQCRRRGATFRTALSRRIGGDLKSRHPPVARPERALAREKGDREGICDRVGARIRPMLQPCHSLLDYNVLPIAKGHGLVRIVKEQSL